MRLLYCLFAVCLAVSAEKLDKCSQGESYWCSDLSIAKQCGAVNHCMDTVWKFQVPREAKGQQGEICDYCENFVSEVRSIIADNATQAQVEQFLLKACGLIPVPEIAQKCTTTVEQNVPEIFKMLESKLQPKALCAALGLCPAFLDLPRQPQNDLEKAKQTLKETALYKRGSKDIGICDYCKNFITSVRDVITKNATVQQVTDYLDQACEAISVKEVSDDCKELVAKNIPELFELIKSELNPDEICKCIGLCASCQNCMIEIPNVRLETAKLRLKQSPLFKQVQLHSIGKVLECDLCKMVMTELQNLDRDAGVQDDLKNFLKQNLCARLPSLKDACETTVEEFSVELFELIVTELDPNTRCVSLGFCTLNGDPSIPKPDPPKPATKHTFKVGASAECIICKFVITEIDQLLGNNRTEPAIEDALDKVCKLLPSAVSLECQEFVNTFAAALVKILATEIDPVAVCETLGACTAVSSGSAKLTDGEVCGICEEVIQYLDSLLEMNSTQQIMEAALEKVCRLTPKALQAQCDDFVKIYGPAVIQLLAQYADPREICNDMKLCSYNQVKEETIVPKKATIVGENECTYGPAFWCTNMDNAKKCNAVSHCKKHVWKN